MMWAKPFVWQLGASLCLTTTQRVSREKISVVQQQHVAKFISAVLLCYGSCSVVAG